MASRRFCTAASMPWMISVLDFVGVSGCWAAANVTASAKAQQATMQRRMRPGLRPRQLIIQVGRWQIIIRLARLLEWRVARLLASRYLSWLLPTSWGILPQRLTVAARCSNRGDWREAQALPERNDRGRVCRVAERRFGR